MNFLRPKPHGRTTWVYAIPAGSNRKANGVPDNVIPFKRPPKVAKPPKERKPPKDPGRWPPATIAFILCVVGYLAIGAFSPWPVVTTLKHFAAATGCQAARTVGLAPAHIGDPGYWSHLDPARTGVACGP